MLIKEQPINFKVLDGLRGIAALYVFIHHARLLLSIPFKDGLAIHPEKYSSLDKLLVYFFGLFKYGHEAVIVFFVLSGFVIHLKQAQPNFNYSEFELNKYFSKRFLRLYPTLITAILLAIILDLTIVYVFKSNFNEIFAKYSLTSLIQNLLLIPNTTDWGNNFPLWSLKHEWFFYLIYPVLLWLSSMKKYYPILLILVLYISFILGFKVSYFNNVAYTIAIWFLGYLMAEIYYKRNFIFNKFLPFLCLSILFYPLIDRYDVNKYPYLDLLFGLFTVGVLAILINGKLKFLNKLISNFKFISAFSYSLYLLHFPFQMFLKNLILKYSVTNTLPYHQWYILISSLLLLPIIYTLYYFTERNFNQIKSTL